MGGQNPYIEDADIEMPKAKYTITFVDEEKREHVVEVDPEKIPYEDHGLPGSILEIAMGNGVDIDHACGGVCACSTCHVVLEEGGDTCNEESDAELDMLDSAPGLTNRSRLACQCVSNGKKNLRVVVPSWNRNLARE